MKATIKNEGQEKEVEDSKAKETCMACVIRASNTMFIHGNTAHYVMCYKCARKNWALHARCPICNKKVEKIVKVY